MRLGILEALSCLCLILLVVEPVSSNSSNCDHDEIFDEDGDNIWHRTFEYTLPNVGTDESYWYNEQYSFYTYGAIDNDSPSQEETTITAKLLTKNNELVYSTKINCDTQTWQSKFIDGKTKLETSTVDHEANDGVTEELSGYLDKACGEDDGMFDLILKVNNAFQMSWIFNAQALQTQTRMVMKTLKTSSENDVQVAPDGKVIAAPVNKGLTQKAVNKPLRMNIKNQAYTGTKIVIAMTGKAKFTRFVFGQCESWPVEYVKQCQKAQQHVQDRSKNNITSLEIDVKEQIATELDTTDEDEINQAYEEAKESDPILFSSRGLGSFGNNMGLYAPACFEDTNMFYYKQNIHPDKFIVLDGKKVAGVYGCCTDMSTGMIYDPDASKPAANRSRARFNDNCKQTLTSGESSTMSCAVSRNEELITEGIAESNS